MLSRDNELAIDLFRGVTALLVLVAHVLYPLIETVLGTDYNTWPLGWQMVGSTFGNGRFWVRFFFVISGFCIHQSISRSIERGGFRLKAYALARITRIYPVFLVGLALAIANWWVFAPEGKEASFPVKELGGSLLMLQQFIGTFPALGPSWSLTSEAFYYAAWPLAILGCGGNQRSALHRSAGITLLVTLLIVAVWKIQFGGDRSHWLISVWGISGLFVVWLGGAWLAIHWSAVQSWITPRVWVLGLVWVLAVYLVEAALVFYQARSWPFMVADYLAIPGFLILIAGGHFLPLSSSARWTSFARWMGMFSYPCYLLHVAIFDMARSAVRGLALPLYPLLQVVLALTFTLVIVATFGVAIERFFMEWRAQYLKRRALRSEVRLPVPLVM